MKKLAMAGIIAAILALAITGVYAFGPNHGGYGPMGWCVGYTNLTPDQKAKVDKFQKDLLPLRQEMIAKRSELESLMLQEKPDWTAIGNKRKELAELGTRMQQKAYEAGVPAPMGGHGRCGGPGQCGGPGMGMGWRMGGMM